MEPERPRRRKDRTEAGIGAGSADADAENAPLDPSVRRSGEQAALSAVLGPLELWRTTNGSVSALILARRPHVGHACWTSCDTRGLKSTGRPVHSRPADGLRTEPPEVGEGRFGPLGGDIAEGREGRYSRCNIET